MTYEKLEKMLGELVLQSRLCTVATVVQAVALATIAVKFGQ